jgi:hypothetical protein
VREKLTLALLLQSFTCITWFGAVTLNKDRRMRDCCIIVFYKQKKGRMKSKGNKSGTMNRLKPQVHGDPMTDAQMMAMILSETMKHPPRLR